MCPSDILSDASDSGVLLCSQMADSGRIVSSRPCVNPAIGQAPKLRRLPEGAPEPAAEPAPTALTNVIPDKYRLVVQPLGDHGDYVAAAKLGELDVLHGEFSIGGSVAGELRVTIRGDSANVEGKATFQDRPAAGAPVYLIPASGTGGGLKVAVCDMEGSYHFEGLAPGDYRIQAWRGSPTAADILSGSGEKLTLQPGEHRTAALQAASAGGQSSSGGGLFP